jgi:hypothetical protein
LLYILRAVKMHTLFVFVCCQTSRVLPKKNVKTETYKTNFTCFTRCEIFICRKKMSVLRIFIINENHVEPKTEKSNRRLGKVA